MHYNHGCDFTKLKLYKKTPLLNGAFINVHIFYSLSSSSITLKFHAWTLNHVASFGTS